MFGYFDVLPLPLEWPADETFRTLTDRAAGLFIWASTASTFIQDGHDPRKRLCLLVEEEGTSGAMFGLDALYDTALRAAGKWEDPDFGADVRAILGVILVARDPISHNVIDKLLCIADDRPSVLTISRLGCVLSQNPTFRILHPFFTDFLSDRVRCGTDAWFFDLVEHNHFLASHCIDLLQSVRRLNI